MDDQTKTEKSPATREQTLDNGDAIVRVRDRWWKIWRPKNPPLPAKPSLSDAEIIPLVGASIFSQLTFSWLNGLMVLGYQRSLQASDLWKLDDSRTASVLSAKLDASWARRCAEAEEYNERLASGEISPRLLRRALWRLRSVLGSTYADSESRWREIDGRAEASLAWALNDTFGWHFWAGGAYKVFADSSQLMGPLVVKAIINFGKARAAARAVGDNGPSLGRGAAMAVGLLLLQISQSIAQHQFFFRSMSTGVLARAALITSIYNRGLNLTPKSSSHFGTAALLNHVSTDVSRINDCSQWFHSAWTAPVQVMICLIILLVQLGPAALAGFSLFVIIVPFQERSMSYQFRTRQSSMKWTDKRAKLLLEMFAGMRIVKYFSYEIPFLKHISYLRKEELKGITKIQISRAANIAAGYSIPIMAATIALVTYSITTPSFDVATIFASFSLFQLLRQPLLWLPRSLSAISDAQSALQRLTKVFHAEINEEQPFVVDPDQKTAIEVLDATWTWEAPPPEEKDDAKNFAKKLEKSISEKTLVKVPEPFQLENVTLSIPRGQLCAVVGPIGCGKSSLLQGLIGQMTRLEGEVSFGGKIAYCSQTAWIQNSTLRDNVLFGQEFNLDRYWKVMDQACLLPDLDMLPGGDFTEIGEKGVNLSGGQKQRVNIARALYADADIVILDDPLSAVDAHVGKKLFENAILRALKGSGKTVLLVTHALHFLPQCDYIYSMADGRISERGTFTDLRQQKGEFKRLLDDFGGITEQEPDVQNELAVEAPPAYKSQANSEEKLSSPDDEKAVAIAREKDPKNVDGRLMSTEKRTIGSVPWSVYAAYLRAAKWPITVPLIVVSGIIMQSSQVFNSYILIWWQHNSFHRPYSFYQIIYACLGISQAIFTFVLGLAMEALSELASRNLHNGSVDNMLHAPMSFFDTTPLGRLISVFGKDIDTMDNQLATSLRLLALTLANVFGAVIIITVIEHYFLIAVFGILIGYSYFAAFYKSSAREVKRIDALLRSFLYAHFSESLSGVPTIRSYGATGRFLKDNQYYCDLENRALYITVTNQRWLALRLDFLGGLLVFVVAMLAVFGVSGISAAQVGLMLSYTTTLTATFSLVTRQSAEVENHMNSVERVVHYSLKDQIEQEAPHEIPERQPPKFWPSEGAVSFQEVAMSYRPGLPNVLKGINLDIRGGEKIGIVGRTGAGKSSMMLALFRIVELNAGRIAIDGVDIAQLGLRDLRTKIAIIPQEPLLFAGTIRSNLDPFNLYDDAHLWDALRRSQLVPGKFTSRMVTPGVSVSSFMDEDEVTAGARTPTSRFHLDTVIEKEGLNLSVGERSLLSLARALVKDSKIVVLDEATASVDLETDSRVQQTIQEEFDGRTLLCIAHRLRTILHYDRILVLDQGNVAEFDTPEALFATEDGIFSSMCHQSGISEEDIDVARSRS